MKIQSLPSLHTIYVCHSMVYLFLEGSIISSDVDGNVAVVDKEKPGANMVTFGHDPNVFILLQLLTVHN